MMAETNHFSIVIIGDMNPRIHHPSWYKLRNIIDEKDASFAIERNDLVCTPPLSQFVTPNSQINCRQDRWEILTERKENSSLILDITKKTFKRLHETPINAYGFNFIFQRKTSCSDVGKILSDLVHTMQIGIPDVAGSASITYRWKKSIRMTTITINPIKDNESMLYLAVNMHYNIPDLVSTPSPSHFDLDELVSKHFLNDEKEAYEIVNNIINSFEPKETSHVIGA